MRTLFTILLAVIAGCSHGTTLAPRSTRTTMTSPAPTDPHRELADARTVTLDRLHAYLVAEVYPLDELGRPESMFRDPSGRLCAMASLIDGSGRGDLVDEVARTNNHLRLADVHDGPLLDWMLHSGLTQEEIALVQGALEIDYSHLRFQQEPVDPRIAAAVGRAEVSDRIRAAEAQLRRDTARSLAVAGGRLPARRAVVAAKQR